jgi:L-rhamnose-H+ transport protein
MSGKAGLNKEQELDAAEKAASTGEFRFGRGLLVAMVAGVMSACMALGFAAGKPIAQLATQAGVAPLWQNLPVLIVVLFGGFCLNFLWCGYLMLRGRSLALYWRTTEPSSHDRMTSSRKPLLGNWGWCALAGVTWYLQFFFYGMGTTKMGSLEFSSWTLHMASIVLFGTAWGFALREWRGTSRTTHLWIAAGLVLLLLSTVIVGWGASMSESPTAH